MMAAKLQRRSSRFQQGFTMLEMSIMLVIIGLLVGGLVIGQAMIHQSEIRKTITEVGQFRTSVNAFFTQYNGLPGDFKEAEQFWGTSSAVNGTQNGDGDKLIEFVNDDTVYEGYRAWQHLARAQLVPGPFSGSVSVGVPIPGLDLPKAELTGGYALESDALGMSGRLVVLLGNPLGSTDTMLMDGNMRPEDAHDIDLKVDDGTPDEGVVRGADGSSAGNGACINTGTSPAKYDLTKTRKDCFIGFQL